MTCQTKVYEKQGGDEVVVVLGIHMAFAGRAASMLQHLSAEPEVVFCGGVALNTTLRRCLSQILGCSIQEPPAPQLVAAHGCALLADART
jgi:activator of 2-hydroxyglutaryl-CoA dehydratase